MKRAFLAALLLAGVTITVAQTSTTDKATWSWTAPTSYTDGTPIPSTTTLTYNLYIGTAGKGSESPTPVQTGITGLTATTTGYAAGQAVCGTLTAVANGQEGPHSQEACKSFATIPGAPGLLVQ